MNQFKATIVTFKSDGISPTLHLKCRSAYKENTVNLL